MRELLVMTCRTLDLHAHTHSIFFRTFGWCMNYGSYINFARLLGSNEQQFLSRKIRSPFFFPADFKNGAFFAGLSEHFMRKRECEFMLSTCGKKIFMFVARAKNLRDF